MTRTSQISLYSFLVLMVFSQQVVARDAARDLRKLVGYTIVIADTVDKVLKDNNNNKYVKLSGGAEFKVEFLFLDPLVLTDVIVFAKPVPKEVAEKFKGKVPEHMLFSYKILIDNEIYDATPSK